MKDPVKIRWARPLPPALLKRLYDADARGLQDMELCDEVGMYLYTRCHTFYLVHRGEVECPQCGTVFAVAFQGTSRCPGKSCRWETTRPVYAQSLRNYNAHTGRAVATFLLFHRRYPEAKTYRQKMLLIDRLIHSFHIDEKTGTAAKSVASKLLEGNKKAVVRFLDALSALHPDEKEKWRRTVRNTIDGRVLRRLTG